MGDEDEWAEKVVPDEQEVEERDDGEGGLAKWDDDFPEDAPMATAIDAGGFVKFFGDAAIELAKEKDVESGAEPRGNPERFERADPSDFAEEDEEWSHENREGDHHGGEHECEERGTAFELDAGKAVRDNCAGKNHADDAKRGDDEGVAEVKREVDGIIGEDASVDEITFGVILANVVFDGLGANRRWRVWKEGEFGISGLGFWFEAGSDHPNQRKEKGGCKAAEDAEGDPTFPACAVTAFQSIDLRVPTLRAQRIRLHRTMYITNVRV